MDLREQILECRERLFAAKGEMLAETMRRLADFELQMLDERLRRCLPEDLRSLQGQVEVWQKMRKYLLESPRASNAS